MNYKGYSIWYNDLQNKWMIQYGYEIYKTCKTLSGAKKSVTAMIKKDL
jgi:hypothetical protein